MVDTPVGGMQPVSPERGREQPHYGGRHAKEPAAEARPERRRDRVDLSPAAGAVLQVLRERVLARTRELLGLPPNPGGPGFAALAEDPTPALFLGRLLSEQNLLAAVRAHHWSADRIRAVLSQALTLGAADALDVLQDVDRLDAEAWSAVEAVLVEFRRKVSAALPGLLPASDA